MNFLGRTGLEEMVLVTGRSVENPVRQDVCLSSPSSASQVEPAEAGGVVGGGSSLLPLRVELFPGPDGTCLGLCAA